MQGLLTDMFAENRSYILTSTTHNNGFVAELVWDDDNKGVHFHQLEYLGDGVFEIVESKFVGIEDWDAIKHTADAITRLSIKQATQLVFEVGI
jgi:hypothetical protein